MQNDQKRQGPVQMCHKLKTCDNKLDINFASQIIKLIRVYGMSINNVKEKIIPHRNNFPTSPTYDDTVPMTNHGQGYKSY